MNTISTINLLPSTKEELTVFVKNTKDYILSGMESPLKIAAQLKAMEELIDTLRKDKEIREYTLKEAEKEGKTFKKHGAEFQVKESGVKYDFSACNDSKYNALLDELIDIKLKVEQRETFLKSLKESVADIDTGEIINLPVKTSTTIVTVKIL